MAIKPKKPAQNGDVTIDRVAAAAGVSRATVSRVMNGSAKVSPEREKAVKKAIAAYNFTPNATARRLAGGRSGLVALLMEESSEEFFLNPFWGKVVFTNLLSPYLGPLGYIPNLAIGYHLGRSFPENCPWTPRSNCRKCLRPTKPGV